MIWEPTSAGWALDMGRIGWMEAVRDGEAWRLVWASFGVETPLEGQYATGKDARLAAHDWMKEAAKDLDNCRVRDCVEHQDDGE